MTVDSFTVTSAKTSAGEKSVRFLVTTMPEKTTKSAKSTKMRDLYRKVLGRPELTDREIDEMRKHVIRLAQTICEHVWGKRFY
jgi:hypothetical protein